MHEAGTPETSLMNDTVGWGGVGSTKNWCDRHAIRVPRLAQPCSLLFRGVALLPHSEMQHDSAHFGSINRSISGSAEGEGEGEGFGIGIHESLHL